MRSKFFDPVLMTLPKKETESELQLGWYMRRLRSMGPVEVLHRVVELQRKTGSRYRHQDWRRYPARPLHTVFTDLRKRVAEATPAQRAAISAAAGETLSGRFAALGRPWPHRDPDNLFPADLWRLDPVTGRFWPGAGTYCFRIDFRHARDMGDIKYVWEINRLQFLTALSAHHVLEGDVRCLRAVEAAIGSWYRANRPFSGVAWSSGIEVALRAISLIVTLDLVGDKLSESTRRQIAQILAASRFWLARFPSRFSSANNHLVAELAGQYLVSLALGLPSKRPRVTLLKEIQKQILEDGTGAEQTPAYASFTAEMALLCASAAKQRDEPFPPSFDARLAAFAEFLDWLGPGSRGFGDDDEGHCVTLGEEPDYKLSVAAGIRGFLGLEGMAAPDEDFRVLIFGKPAAASLPKSGLRSFEHGGLSVWRGRIGEQAVALTFDHGPLGYLSIAAHGHADALSVTLSVDDVPVLVDPGTWQYSSGGVWRTWFRSTPAHNTLSIAGQSQSVITGAFSWSRKANATLIETKDGANWQLLAQHDGYVQPFGLVHQRHLQRLEGEIAITDRLLGGEIKAEIVFQLGIGLAAQQDDDIVTIAGNGRTLLRMQFPSADLAIASGGDLPGQGGWVSPRFGVREPAARIVWSGVVNGEGVTTRLIF